MATVPDHSGPPTTMDARRATAALVDLPVELFIRISRDLTTPDFCALRLACRATERALFLEFGRVYFTRKCFMISQFGLQALVDIAKHPALGPMLTHVSLAHEFLQQLAHNFSDAVPTSTEQDLFERARTEEHTIVASGVAQAMLTDAFRHLPNLETVEFRTVTSQTRFRDFPIGLRAWHSYGFPTLCRSLGIDPDCPRRPSWPEGPVTASMYRHPYYDPFTPVLSALVMANARPQRLLTRLRRNTGLGNEHFYLPPAMADQYAAVLGGLRTIHLDLNLITNGSRSWLLHSRNKADLDEHVANVHRLLTTAAPSLETLRLNLNAKSTTSEAEYLLARLCHTSRTSGPAGDDRVRYPRLRTLEIGYAVLSMCTLLDVLAELPGLEMLTLHCVTLAWQTPLRKAFSGPVSWPIAGPAPLWTAWPRLITGIGERLSNLRRLTLWRMQESFPLDGEPLDEFREAWRGTFLFVNVVSSRDYKLPFVVAPSPGRVAEDLSAFAREQLVSFENLYIYRMRQAAREHGENTSHETRDETSDETSHETSDETRDETSDETRDETSDETSDDEM